MQRTTSIETLPPDVAAEIAAGEVIERPASAVKELVENAIDAGATAITVEIEAGGVRLIRVTDDGCGMTEEDLARSIQRHATSKLRRASDLARISTLGFRGEALPSMVAAADVEIRSAMRGSPGGATLEARNGTPAEPRAAGVPVGTSVTLRDLFGRQPARRAFLKTASGETARVAALVSRFALAYPAVRFTLVVDGRRTLETAGSGDPRDVAGRVLGAATAARLLDVQPHDGDPSIDITGLVSPPDMTRPSRSGMALFLNGRWIESRRLIYAAESAYETLLHGGRHPIVILDLRLPPEEVDVNVHPAKAEVRFRRESVVFSAVHRAVRGTLLATAPVPRIGDRGQGTGNRDEGDGASVVVTPSFWPAGLGFDETPAPDRGGAPAAVARPVMPVLRVIGQMGTTYIIAEAPDGMYLIDQHAAHERVLYERFLTQRAEKAPEVQGLLDPVVVDLTAAQAAVVVSESERLAELGFDVAPFGDRALAVRAIPSALRGDPATTVTRLLDALAEPEAVSPEGADRVTMTLACHAAVRAGMTLSLEEMRETVRLLEQCRSPRTCPHGRPTMMHLSADTLDREFRRR